MSNDPATLLRESERVEIPAVLEIGHAGNAAALPLMLTDPVVIPVQLEWTGGEAPRRAASSSAPAAPAEPVSAGLRQVGHAPVTPRRRGRFPVGN